LKNAQSIFCDLLCEWEFEHLSLVHAIAASSQVCYNAPFPSAWHLDVRNTVPSPIVHNVELNLRRFKIDLTLRTIGCVQAFNWP
jgi:hypothetical protein